MRASWRRPDSLRLLQGGAVVAEVPLELRPGAVNVVEM